MEKKNVQNNSENHKNHANEENLTESVKIDAVARKILKKYRRAFEELAK